MKTLTTLFLFILPFTLVAQFNVRKVKELKMDRLHSGVYQGNNGTIPAYTMGVSFQGQLYFNGGEPAYGNELYVSNGTLEGTYLLADINPGPASSYPRALYVVGNKLYFLAETEETGRELFVTDGTTEGTQLVKDVVPGVLSTFRDPLDGDFENLGDIVFFYTSDGLWRTDGTSEGTRKIKGSNDSNDPLGAGANSVRDMTPMGGGLYFTASDASGERKLWRTDGTTANTRLIIGLDDQRRGATPFNLFVYRNMLYFTVSKQKRSTQLFRSNGTAEGTEMVYDFGDSGLCCDVGDHYVPEFTEYNDLLFFTAHDGQKFGLWSTDGTTLGTKLIVRPEYDKPVELTVVDSLLLFVSRNAVHDRSVYRSNGTAEGTYPLTGQEDYPAGFVKHVRHFHPFGENVFFSCSSRDPDFVFELFVTNGQIEGTYPYLDLYKGPGKGHPHSFVTVNDLLFFYAHSGEDSPGLYVLSSGDLPYQSFRQSENDIVNSCTGDDGAATIRTTGGIPPYTMGNLTSTDGVFELDNLSPDDYEYVIYDALDSIVAGTFTVLPGTNPFIELISLIPRYEIITGTISVSGSNGTPPYQYDWAYSENYSWPHSGDNDSIQTSLNHGTYYLTMTDALGCVAQDSFVIENLTATATLNTSDFHIYPTITSGRLTLELSGSLALNTIDCYDLKGSLLTTVSGGGHSEIELTNGFLPQVNGTYLIAFTTTNGKRGIRRIVVFR